MGFLFEAAKHVPFSTSVTLYSYASPRSLPAFPTLAQLREQTDKAAAALQAIPTLSHLTVNHEPSVPPVKMPSDFGAVRRPRENHAGGRTPPPKYVMRDPADYAFTHVREDAYLLCRR